METKNILRVFYIIPLSLIGTLLYWLYGYIWFGVEPLLGSDVVFITSVSFLFSLFIPLMVEALLSNKK